MTSWRPNTQCRPRATKMGCLTACALAVLAAVVAAVPQAIANPPAKPLVVVVPAPLAGPQAATGLSMHTAIAIAAAELNAGGGVAGQRIELRLVDDPCTSSGGDALMRGLARESDIDVIIGHPCGPSARAATALYRDAGRLFIAVGSRPTRPAPGAFRLPSSQPLGEALAATILQSTQTSERAHLAVLRDRTQLSTLLGTTIEQAARTAGIAVVTESFPGGQRDFAAFAASLRAKNVTHIALLAFPVEAGFAVRALTEAMPEAKLFGPDHMGTADFAQMAGSAAANVRIVAAASLDHYAKLFPPARALTDRLRSTGVAPTREALEAVAALQAWAAAASSAPVTGTAAPRGVDLAVQANPTVLGALAFDKAGDATLPFWLVHRWRDGALVPE
jgi:branched-chain amino acid transport system substrate-binding protein